MKKIVKIVLNNKTGPLFLNLNWCEKSFSFLKDKQRDEVPLIIR